MGSRFKGPLTVFRIADRRYRLLDGAGAMRYGGRWNSPGREAIYAAETYAGAVLEKLAHANIGRIPKNQVFIEILIPKRVEIEAVTAAEVPGWDLPGLVASRAYGDAWLSERRTAVLMVPSMVTRVERNVVINPEHRDFARMRATAPRTVIWDARLFG